MVSDRPCVHRVTGFCKEQHQHELAPESSAFYILVPFHGSSQPGRAIPRSPLAQHPKTRSQPPRSQKNACRPTFQTQTSTSVDICGHFDLRRLLCEVFLTNTHTNPSSTQRLVASHSSHRHTVPIPGTLVGFCSGWNEVKTRSRSHLSWPNPTRSSPSCDSTFVSRASSTMRRFFRAGFLESRAACAELVNSVCAILIHCVHNVFKHNI